MAARERIADGVRFPLGVAETIVALVRHGLGKGLIHLPSRCRHAGWRCEKDEEGTNNTRTPSKRRESGKALLAFYYDLRVYCSTLETEEAPGVV